MKSFFFKIWRDPVWSKVIAVAITGAGLFLWNKISINTFNLVLAWLKIEYPIPLGVFFILVLLLLPCLGKKIAAVISFLRKPPFDPEANRSKIEKAVYEKRNITGFDLLWTGIRNDNSFLEFCLKDFSETWLIQEIPTPILINDVKRQIRIVNRHLAEREARHNKVIIILLVYRILTIAEKTNLYSQLLLFNSTENLTSKITFQVWDKTDIDKLLEK